MRKYCTIFTLVLSCAFFVCYGQTGTIRGKVYDKIEQSGLSGASVTIPAIKRGTLTDLDGNFQFDSVPAGTYSVVARYIGYGDTTILNIVVAADSISLVNFILPPPCPYDKNRSDKTCPICNKKDKVVPIVYGLPIGPLDKKRYYYAGCVVTKCDPNWYCKRNQHKF